MPKTKEQLEALKTRVDELSKELQELSEDELNQVAGGLWMTQETMQGYIRAQESIERQGNSQKSIDKGNQWLVG